MTALFPELGYWLPTRDGDPRVTTLYRRHYSSYPYKDNRRYARNRDLVAGPGEKIVLIGADCRAVFCWRKFKGGDGQAGINCAFFRNEGERLSSELILEAEEYAWTRWPGERLYTYVNPTAVQGDGKCFKVAGWHKCGRTKVNRLIILEKLPQELRK